MLQCIIQMLCVLAIFSAHGQSEPKEITVWQLNKSYASLQEGFDNAATSTLEQQYAYAFLAKAKEEKNHLQLFQGYKNLLHLQNSYNSRLQYADSMFFESHYLDKNTIASALLTKGAVHYNAKKYSPALECYLAAKKLLLDDPCNDLTYKAQYCIAQVKYYMGYYSESISLLTPCVAFYKRSDSRGYINSLHLLGLCYNRNGDYKNSAATNELGITQASIHRESGMLPYFLHSDGINQLFLGNYALSLKYLESTLPFLESRGDYANTSVAWFYIGLNYEKTGETEKALSAYKKVYEIFISQQYIRPDLIHAIYALSIESKRVSNVNQQLLYTTALLSADSLLHADFRHLTHQLQREYNTNELSKEKNELLNNIKVDPGNNWWPFVILLPFIAAACLYTKIFIKKNTLNIRQGSQKETAIPNISTQKTSTVSLKFSLAEALLEKLNKFEAEHKYLGKDMSLAKMAKIMGTNTKYVSMLIHQYRGKKTTEYLNDLKIEYLVSMFLHNKRYRAYKHQAMAQLIGFSATNSLHKAFLNHMGITLQAYLEGLQNNEPENQSPEPVNVSRQHTNPGNIHPQAY